MPPRRRAPPVRGAIVLIFRAAPDRAHRPVAVAATLATMLVRFDCFRRILLTERRDWPERLVFAVVVGHPARRRRRRATAAPLRRRRPHALGLVSRRADRRPVRRRARRRSASACPATFAGEWGALPFAVGCGFAGGGLREICPKEEIWRFTPFFVTKLHQSAWRLIRNALARLAGDPRDGARRCSRCCGSRSAGSFPLRLLLPSMPADTRG